VTDAAIRDSGKSPGLFGKALIGLFMKRAAVTAVSDLGNGFRLITLEGPQLRGVAWVAGWKIQVAMGSAFVARTYTPMEWDGIAGRTQILGYAHGAGPGSDWLIGLRVGDECDILGPRPSLKIQGLPGPLAVFGDETSMGLGHALRGQEGDRFVTCQFEVSDVTGADRILSTLRSDHTTVVGKTAGGGHLDETQRWLSDMADAGASFILTGNSESVQRLRHHLRRIDVPVRRIVTKAYWAVGKVGLD
jgi:NADPH-dependent ferric siderophore reductase